MLFVDGSLDYSDLSLNMALDQVSKFEANFGGTEIYAPLNEIFESIKGKPQTHGTHIYLLTDGAVHNNGAIIDLVKQNCLPSNRIRLHTFGVGNGADERLIKGCAFAGMGNFTFIYNENEIEQKVMESVSKTKLDYLIVTEAKILDEDDNVIEEMADLPVPIQPGTLFDYQTLLVGKEKAAYFSVKIYDPNQQTAKEYSRPIKATQNQGLLNHAVSKAICRFNKESQV